MAEQMPSGDLAKPTRAPPMPPQGSMANAAQETAMMFDPFHSTAEPQPPASQPAAVPTLDIPSLYDNIQSGEQAQDFEIAPADASPPVTTAVATPAFDPSSLYTSSPQTTTQTEPPQQPQQPVYPPLQQTQPQAQQQQQVPVQSGGEAQDGTVQERERERDQRVIMGPVPEDFLRIVEYVPAPLQPQMQYPMQGMPGYPPLRRRPHPVAMLRLTIMKAKLAKNYGILRMDPFVIISIGRFHQGTTPCTKGGIEPRWNQQIEIPVFRGYSTFRIDVYDFRALGDKLIASADLPLSMLEGEPAEHWLHLNGEQGEGKEGVLHVHGNCAATRAPPGYVVDGGPYLMTPPQGTMPQQAPPTQQGMAQPQQQQQPQQQLPVGQAPPMQPTPPNPEHARQLKEMFPTIEDDVIMAVLQSAHGNMDAATTNLLQLVE
eukprot:m.132587 g.132587  ORF g.132587 m.132587 type:complete len:430 (+) comp13936_c0_seq1:173-1462(+)